MRFRRDGVTGELDAWFVAGADGVGSAVRRGLAIALRQWGHEQRYVVGFGARPARLEDGAALIHHGPGYADGVMPLGQRAYFYDSVTAGNRSAVDASDLTGWLAAYACPVCGGAHRPDHELGAAERPRSASRSSPPRTAAGAALLGDAAATVHPHAAQGANVALEDGGPSESSLRASTRPASFGAATSRPTSAGAGARRRYVAWSRFVGAAFDGETALWRTIRWSGWQWQRLPPARRALLRRGAGLR